MREKINENPIAQIALIGILVIATGYLLMTRVFGGEEVPPPADTASVSVTTTGTDGATSTATVDPSVVSTGVPTTVPMIEDAPLPRDLVAAYNSGSTVAVLIIRPGGIDDRMVAGAVERLRSDPGVSLFVDTADHISRYTQITQAVGVDRTPALIVLRPKRLSGGAAAASVSYGFQDTQSINQAITDAVYKGRTIGYSPD